MKEIKFRAYIKSQHDMVNVGDIDIVRQKITYYIGYGYYLESVCADFSNIELLQYTGFKDKDDKEIYEGDIVRYHTENISFEEDTIGVVEYYKGTFGIVSDERQHFLSFYNMSAYVRYIEVIGNIYENPELIGE